MLARNKKEEAYSLKKKKLRVPLITVAVLAVLVLCYIFAFMRPQPLMNCMTGTQPPTSGEIICYTGEEPDGRSLTVTSTEQVAQLWQAIQDAQIRFLRGRRSAVIPQGGAYYTVTLFSEDSSSIYAFGYDTEGGLIIQGSAYKVLGEDQLGPALAAICQQTAE